MWRRGNLESLYWVSIIIMISLDNKSTSQTGGAIKFSMLVWKCLDGRNHLSFIPDIASTECCLVFWASSGVVQLLEVSRARQLVKHILDLLSSKYNRPVHIAKLEIELVLRRTLASISMVWQRSMVWGSGGGMIARMPSKPFKFPLTQANSKKTKRFRLRLSDMKLREREIREKKQRACEYRAEKLLGVWS